MNKEELKYSYLEYSPDVTNEIFDEIILKLKDLGFIEFSTNNGYANFSKDGDSKLILSPNFEYYISNGDIYDRTRLKVSDIIGEETKFEVGKWYSFYWNWSSGYNCIGKVCQVNTYEKTVIQFDNYTSNNSPGELFTDGRTIDLAEIENIKELNLEEIQQYLPDNHPDRIVKEEVEFIEKWSVGSYVVFCRNNTCKKVLLNKPYKIEKTIIKDHIKIIDESGNFDSTHYTSRFYDIKWFATLSEAEAFSESLLEPKKEDLSKYDSEGNLIKRKEYVHCETQEQWNFVLSKFNLSDLYESTFNIYSSIGIDLSNGCYTDSDWYDENGYKKVTFQEWLNLNGYTFEEGMSNKFNVGDEVKVCSKSEDLKGHGFLDSLRDKISPINGVAGSTGIIKSLKEYAGTIYYELDRFAPNGYISEDCLKLIKSCVMSKEAKEMQLSDLKNPIFNVGDKVMVTAYSLRELNSSWTRGNNTSYKEGYIGTVSNVISSSKKEINTWCYLEDHSSAISCNLLELVESSESSKPKKIDRNVYYEVETQEQYEEILDWLESNGEVLNESARRLRVNSNWKYVAFNLGIDGSWALYYKKKDLSKAEFQFKGKLEKQPIKAGMGLREQILCNSYLPDSVSFRWEAQDYFSTQNSITELNQESTKLLSLEEDDVVLFKTNSVKISNEQLIIND